MDQRKIVYKETAIIAVGELILTGIMVGIFAALGYFRMNVLWGAVTGSAIMIVNYFFMAVTVSLAADKAEQGDVQQAQKLVQLSSTVRLVVMGVALLLGIKLGADVLALLLPMLFARPILMLSEFFRKKGDA
ncbi:MAG: ATP synthase subunit I [Oscillospiraceae bacterium]|nr:ATP synthase subunit I [Oscillospiraceae bacterium]